MQPDSAISAVATSTTALLDTVYYNNTARVWLVALATFTVVFGVLIVARGLIIRRLARSAERTTTRIDDLALTLVRETRPFILVVLAIVAGLTLLELPPTARDVVRQGAVIALLLQTALGGGAFITFWLRHATAEKAATDLGSVTTLNALGVLARLILWVVIFLLALANFGIDVTALIAGLGIAGIAVALAVQNILGDLLASLSIVLDKPFVVGDFITVDTLSGTVEEVGLKTTRLRSISGEQLIFSNSDLLKARIQNYKRMTERRIVFGLGVEYSTGPELVERIPGMIQEIVAGVEQVRFDRSHFQRFGPSSLDFETAYFVLVPDYNVYMDVQQRINLEIMRRFRDLGIEFAFPTQTLWVREEKREPDAEGEGQAAARRSPLLPRAGTRR